MKFRSALGAAGALLLSTSAFAQTAAPAPTGVTFSTFIFQTNASRNPDFDRSAYVYPEGNALAGQVNPNTGDVRLDSVGVNGLTYDQDQLAFVTGARILVDDAVDAARGGGDLATGYGIGADIDTWADQGTGTTTPTADNLVAAQSNFNLTSLGVTREGVGTAIYELSFDDPTDTLFLWERGNSGDVLVSALDGDGKVLGSIKLHDGSNDGDVPSDYVRTGITVTTFVQDGFLNQGEALSAVGLRLSEPASSFRFTVYQEAEGDGAVRYNGPDLKVLALHAAE